MIKNRGNWGSRLGFIMAAAGSAIGLGNVWKFPYITGVHGGGAFVLLYLFCICLIGIPVMLAEFIVGRSTQRNPLGAMEQLEGKKNFWLIPAIMGVLAAFLILTYYSVVAGWIFDYLMKAFSGEFSAGHDPEAIKSMLGALLGDGHWQTFMHGIFISLTTFIVMFGIHSGVEKASNILMPILFVILTGLVVYSFSLDGIGDALNFLFYPALDKLTPQGALEAVGHSFFTLSVGIGIMVTYGSYLKKDQSLIRSAGIIAGLDTLIALMAGLVIFSIVFSFNLDPGKGPALIFSTLPALFTQIPGGGFLAIAFFLLMLFAALTSSISLLEVLITYLVDTYEFSRKKVTVVTGFVIFVLGTLHSYSYNLLSDVKLPLAFLFGEDLVFFDSFDKISSNILLPLGGMLFSIYVGWKLDRTILNNEFTEKEKAILPGLVLILKYIAPFFILIVFLYGLSFTHPIFKTLGLIH